MKRIFEIVCLFLFAAGVPAIGDDALPAQPAPLSKGTFLITGLHCPPCTKTLESSLKSRPGIRSVQIDWKTKNARIEFDEAVVPAQKVSQLIGTTPHMMGAQMRYGGWLALKVPAVMDDASAAPVKAALAKLAGIKSVTAYPAQHAVGIQFTPDGKLRSVEVIELLQRAGIEATNY